MYIYHYFKRYTILKNQFLIIGVDNDILIFDIFYGKLLKRYRLLLEGENNLFFLEPNIKKWNNDNDNEFFIDCNGIIILFELTYNKELKIISQTYFKDIISLKRLNEKDNKFYDDGDDDDDEEFYFCNNDNKKYSVSIYD